MRGAAIFFVAFLVMGSQALGRADWPTACDAHAGRRVELLTAYGCSQHLLSGGAVEIAGFIFLWTLPLSVLALILYYRQRKGAAAGQISVE